MLLMSYPGLEPHHQMQFSVIPEIGVSSSNAVYVIPRTGASPTYAFNVIPLIGASLSDAVYCHIQDWSLTIRCSLVPYPGLVSHHQMLLMSYPGLKPHHQMQFTVISRTGTSPSDAV